MLAHNPRMPRPVPVPDPSTRASAKYMAGKSGVVKRRSEQPSWLVISLLRRRMLVDVTCIINA